MRPIHVTTIDKPRPAVILTRELVRPHLNWVTVAPITGTIRGLSTEVAVGRHNGLDKDSVISCDNVATIPVDACGRLIGYLNTDQEAALAKAIAAAFDLQW